MSLDYPRLSCLLGNLKEIFPNRCEKGQGPSCEQKHWMPLKSVQIVDDMRRSDLGTSINITYKPVDPLIASVVQVDPHHCLMCLIIGFSCHDGRCEDDLRGWKEGPFCDGCFRYNQYETHKVLMSYRTNDSGLGLNASVPPRFHDGSTQRSLLTLRLCSEEEKLVVPGPTLGLFIVIIRLSLHRVC